MSVRVCVHPSVMKDPVSIHVSRYGSVSSSISNAQGSPTSLISISAVAAISLQDANASRPLTYQAAPMRMRDGMTYTCTSPASRMCTLPEIPSSPSSQSIASSDSPPILKMRNVREKQTEESLAGSSAHNTARNSMFPNFRALQRALSAKTRTLSLNQNSRRNSSIYDQKHDFYQSSTPSKSSRSRTPIINIANDQAQKCQDLQRSRSLDTETPAGFVSLATLPGNRYEDNQGQRTTASADQMINVYVADHAVVPSKIHMKKKSAKKKKKKKSTKSRAQYLHKHPQESKQPGKTSSDKDDPLQDNSLGTLLRAIPVVVETKKIEVYSSRYSKCDTEGVKTHQTNTNSPRDEKGDNQKHPNSTRKDLSQGITTIKVGTQGLYASRVSSRIPGVSGLNGGLGETDGLPRMTRVYLSDKQSGNLRECGLILPRAPPGTPTPQMMQRYQYIPSMMDLRSQRAVRDRLSGMEQKAKKKQLQQREEARKTEQQLHRDQAVVWKHRQRQEIYALNKIMTDFEEKNFQEFMKMSGKTP